MTMFFFARYLTFYLFQVLWTGLPCPNFHLLICIAILETERETIMSNDNGLSDILAVSILQKRR
jgi:hypothetical protein